MKAIISTTFDDKYLFYLPITTWLWNKLGVEVVCFMPDIEGRSINLSVKQLLVLETMSNKYTDNRNRVYYFSSPEHKEATYSQCSRLYAAALDLPEDEVLITSDMDMGVFQLPDSFISDHSVTMSIVGIDLVPEGQFPMCYISGSVKDWRKAFLLNGISYQEALDRLLAQDECEDYRACRWSVDQEQAYFGLNNLGKPLSKRYRAKPGTQFASNRYDRDDAFLLDRLSPDTIDYHMPRPGYEENNFNQILTVLKYHYPNEDLTWTKEYQKQYKALL